MRGILPKELFFHSKPLGLVFGLLACVLTKEKCTSRKLNEMKVCKTAMTGFRPIVCVNGGANGHVPVYVHSHVAICWPARSVQTSVCDEGGASLCVTASSVAIYVYRRIVELLDRVYVF